MAVAPVKGAWNEPAIPDLRAAGFHPRPFPCAAPTGSADITPQSSGPRVSPAMLYDDSRSLEGHALPASASRQVVAGERAAGAAVDP